ncbi:uncharacterized protein LOC114378313 [Glycine soja]|uniref:Uncharacterized protein n=1 Tax=Glycine soja TaxID=3848 RepID=A0A445HMR6_GLYSO|nr:uncharacterized protein LOC114378313 [Glycine soja]RZB75067.1 hypothetical protein D0Y65_033808 [Glycine soja]
MLFYIVLLFHHHFLLVNSEHQRNFSHTGISHSFLIDRARTMAMTSSRETIASVNRRGGGGHGGGHASSMGMHGGENGEHGNLPRPLGTNPVYAGAAAGSAHQRNNNHHHGKSNGTLNYVCFYHFLLLFLSMAIGISLCT